MPLDHFALLGQPRRPWLDVEKLKEAFHRLVAEQHPDKAGDTTNFADVNTAYATLCDPARRLRHFLELEEPDALAGEQEIPKPLAETFMRIAALRQAAAQLTLAAASPLALALHAPERLRLQREVETEMARLEAAQAEAEASVEHAPSAPPLLSAGNLAWVHHLAARQQEMCYLSKWLAQLRETLFQLQAPS